MRYTGAVVKRREDPRLLAGRGAYLDDIRPDGCLHVAFVRSPYAHARVVAVDARAARARRRVATVLTGRELATGAAPLAPRLQGDGFFATQWAPLAPEHARFVGEPVAALAAQDAYEAADAVEAIEVEYAPLPAVASVDAAGAADAPRVHPGIAGNVLFERRGSRGDVDGAFARAAVRLAETFSHGRVSGAPLEPRGLVASWTGDRLTVWMSTQAPHMIRAGLAAAFGVAPDAVRVIVPDTGGGFGQKMALLPEEVAVARPASPGCVRGHVR